MRKWYLPFKFQNHQIFLYIYRIYLIIRIKIFNAKLNNESIKKLPNHFTSFLYFISPPPIFQAQSVSWLAAGFIFCWLSVVQKFLKFFVPSCRPQLHFEYCQYNTILSMFTLPQTSVSLIPDTLQLWKLWSYQTKYSLNYSVGISTRDLFIKGWFICERWICIILQRRKQILLNILVEVLHVLNCNPRISALLRSFRSSDVVNYYLPLWTCGP